MLIILMSGSQDRHEHPVYRPFLALVVLVIFLRQIGRFWQNETMPPTILIYRVYALNTNTPISSYCISRCMFPMSRGDGAILCREVLIQCGGTPLEETLYTLITRLIIITIVYTDTYLPTVAIDHPHLP